jgi:ABC-type nitrate/sulfonate/bicarbonate transport system permease component
MRHVSNISPSISVIILIIIFWEVAVKFWDIPRGILPAPSQIMGEAFRLRSVLLGHALTTVTEALGGLILAIFVGAIVGALISSFGFIRRAFLPILVITQNIPMMVLAPLIVVWFGFGIQPKIGIVTLVCFFPIAINTADALMRSDQELLELLKSMGATRWQLLRLVRIPQALPAFFSGLQIAATYAILGAVFSEFAGGTSGLWLFIGRSQRAYRTDQMFVAVVLIALLSICLFLLVRWLARVAMPWHSSEGAMYADK